MSGTTGEITFKGNPMTLLGEKPATGQEIPDFTATAIDLSQKSIRDYRGKVVLLSVVPSLDTGVCDTQTRKFNERVAALDGDVALLTLSMDLPFAQKRWCGHADAANVETLSDYRDHAAGEALGLRIAELGLLTRAVLVIDRDGVVRHFQIVPEVTQEPDYEAAVEAVQSLL